MNRRLEKIKIKINSIPTQPGCYLWLAEEKKIKNNTILYIGKANNLRVRVRQYLKSEEYKTRFLMSKVQDIDYIVTSNEMEALLLESNLIKTHNPPYNIRLKDDKRYPYLCLTMGEVFPKLIITRKKTNMNHIYFGPFSDAKAARNTMTLIEKIFPIRKRALKLPLKSAQKPCLNYHLKRCWGPCTGKIDTEEYKTMVLQIKDFLSGKDFLVQKNLRNKMIEYSKKLEFEKAGRIRDILTDIKETTKDQKVHGENSEKNFDIAGLFVAAEDSIFSEIQLDNNENTNETKFYGQIVLLKIRNGNLISKENYAMTENLFINNNSPEKVRKKQIYQLYIESIKAFFLDYYMEIFDFPEKIFLSHHLNDIKYWEKLFKEKSNKKIEIFCPKRIANKTKNEYDEIHDLMNMAVKNAELTLRERILSAKSRSRQTGLRQIQKILKIAKPIEFIECYDISNISGREAVGAGISLKDGLIYKSGYRKYRIKTLESPNDPAMIYEVLTRRLKKINDSKISLPDLIVIDGGRTQLNAAIKARNENSINIPIISLAKKNEEVYLENNQILQMDKNSPGMLILRLARDEAHRFGLLYHRNLRIKRNLSSVLDNIKDIGDILKQRISVELRKIDYQNENITTITNRLLQIKGINKLKAHHIAHKLLNKEIEK
ncbi:MAG: excinuclease ABC subunit UvrC [Spirochaetia bacterium]|nr:excinuclease ABC subunit UvrC [Spirochaetia bacterium]